MYIFSPLGESRPELTYACPGPKKRCFPRKRTHLSNEHFNNYFPSIKTIFYQIFLESFYFIKKDYMYTSEIIIEECSLNVPFHILFLFLSKIKRLRKLPLLLYQI